MAMNIFDYELFLMFIVCEREARGDGLQAMRAVAHVIVNRKKAGWDGKSVYGVITSKNQFSSMTILGDSQTIIWPAFDVLTVEMLSEVYNGGDMDTTDGALYYANEAVEKSAWYKENVIDKLPVKVIIGKQTFR